MSWSSAAPAIPIADDALATSEFMPGSRQW
jgi:hypothetical protein